MFIFSIFVPPDKNQQKYGETATCFRSFGERGGREDGDWCDGIETIERQRGVLLLHFVQESTQRGRVFRVVVETRKVTLSSFRQNDDDDDGY